MKIVVDVPDEEYDSYALAITFGMGNTAIRRILNGTPLPEGHGRLIDADALKKKHQWTDDFYETEYVEVEDIDDAPTIIEADKEGAEE